MASAPISYTPVGALAAAEPPRKEGYTFVGSVRGVRQNTASANDARVFQRDVPGFAGPARRVVHNRAANGASNVSSRTPAGGNTGGRTRARSFLEVTKQGRAINSVAPEIVAFVAPTIRRNVATQRPIIPRPAAIAQANYEALQKYTNPLIALWNIRCCCTSLTQQITMLVRPVSQPAFVIEPSSGTSVSDRPPVADGRTHAVPDSQQITTESKEAYPTAAIERSRDKRRAAKAVGTPVEVKHQKKWVEEPYDNCGEDLSSLHLPSGDDDPWVAPSSPAELGSAVNAWVLDSSVGVFPQFFATVQRYRESDYDRLQKAELRDMEASAASRFTTHG